VALLAALSSEWLHRSLCHYASTPALDAAQAFDNCIEFETETGEIVLRQDALLLCQRTPPRHESHRTRTSPFKVGAARAGSPKISNSVSNANSHQAAPRGLETYRPI
jgi:hypothetical protein